MVDKQHTVQFDVIKDKKDMTKMILTDVYNALNF